MSTGGKITRAVLLAAGRGKRLQPYTDNTPKPLLIYRGKPTLDYILDSLEAANVSDIVLVTHHLSEQLEQYAQLRTARSNQNLSCVRQEYLFGTSHALQSVVEHCPEFFDESFLLSATDYLVSREFYSNLLNFHAEHGAPLTVSLKQLPEAELTARSSVRFRQDDSIAEIVEKPPLGTAPSRVGANLSFVLPPDILSYVEDVPVSARGEREIQQAINMWIQAGGCARGLIQPVPLEWEANSA